MFTNSPVFLRVSHSADANMLERVRVGCMKDTVNHPAFLWCLRFIFISFFFFNSLIAYVCLNFIWLTYFKMCFIFYAWKHFYFCNQLNFILYSHDIYLCISWEQGGGHCDDNRNPVFWSQMCHK